MATLMFDRARLWPDRPMLRGWRDGAWHSLDWGGFARQAASAARNLRAAGISAGDRVVLVTENRPELVIAELALMAIRAVPVPAYPTNTAADHAHILSSCGARAAIVSHAGHAARLREASALAVGLDLLVSMQEGVDGVLDFATLVADRAPPDDIAAEAAIIPPGALACLMFTSGTSGAPRGVMLSHRAILANCRSAFHLLRPLRLRDEVYLSFLPASHSYEHLVGLFLLPSLGTEIVFARGLEHLAADFLAARPTLMTVVPRVLEVLEARIAGQVLRLSPWRRRLFAHAQKLGVARAERRAVGVFGWAQDWLLDRLVRAKIRARFGGRLRAVMSGGAKLDPATGQFFQGLGLLVMQGYGQTEAGPVISATPPDAVRLDSVGPPLQGVEIRIAEDGEVLVRGDLLMEGYWGLPQATAETLRHGWLHTGDIGRQDEDGCLVLTDRKKDIIVLSGGDKVSPARIEALLMREPEIAQAVVAGDGRPGLVALLVAAENCDELGVALALSRANLRLPVPERIRRHVVVGAFTVENGLLTPTQKIRRVLVLQAHRTQLAALPGSVSV